MASFDINTVNRLQARKLLNKCGVDGARARAMSLREIKEHLENFVSLGSISEAAVLAGLATSTQEMNRAEGKPDNAGAPWTPAEDKRLNDAFALGSYGSSVPQSILDKLATEHGRTAVGISARLEKNGFVKPNNVINFAALNAYRDANGIVFDHGTRTHVRRVASTDEFETVPEPTPMRAEPTTETAAHAAKGETVKTAETNNVQDAVAQAMGAALGPIFAQLAANNKPAIDVDQIRAIIAEEVPKHVGAYQRFEVKRTDGSEFKMEGLAHYAMPRLLKQWRWTSIPTALSARNGTFAGLLTRRERSSRLLSAAPGSEVASTVGMKATAARPLH